MHLNAYDLRQAGWVQLSLFDPPADQARAVSALKRKVNDRVGRFSLRSGATLPLADGCGQHQQKGMKHSARSRDSRKSLGHPGETPSYSFVVGLTTLLCGSGSADFHCLT
jgi:hypothetical protein